MHIHRLLTAALDRGEWSDSRPGYFIPGERTWYELDGRLCGPPVIVEHLEGKQIQGLVELESLFLGRVARSLLVTTQSKVPGC